MAEVASRTEVASRSVTFRDEGKGFVDNEVITSHYTVANFVPLNLYEQFCKPANVYFFILCVLQTIPQVTTTGSMPTNAAPLLFVLAVNAMKDMVEDYRRHKSDRLENERTTLVLAGKGEQVEPTKWHNVRVGNVVVVKCNEYIPADMVLLSSCHEEGHAFIETANLDGETNLKTKQAPTALFSMVGSHERYEDAVKVVAGMEGSIECEGPNEFLYVFTGAASAGANATSPKENVSLDEQHVLLRGCKLKNVRWAIGVTIYTGRETKIMMNSKEKKGRKLSHLERQLGKLTFAVFCVQCFLCLISAIIGAVGDVSDESKQRTYLDLTNSNGEAKQNAGAVLFFRFLTFILLFANFIPISLLVSVSCVKLIQIFLMYSDREMIYMDIPCTPRTSDLNDEMGQVAYVFSDKTGTLTRNVMDFRQFCVKGKSYGEGMTEIKRNVMLKMGKDVPDPPSPPPGSRSTPHVDLVDHKLEELMNSRQGAQYEAIRTFMLHLAINHEVVVEPDEEGGQLSYSGSSPDEAALCYGAMHYGFVFKSRDAHGITVELNDGTTLRVNILALLKFNSSRKRSSVIVSFDEKASTGDAKQRFFLYCKGADSVIMERLRADLQSSLETQHSIDTLRVMAEDGLRTLCLAGRELSQDEVNNWLRKHADASIATTNRQERLDAVAEEIECKLEMHGITGIEDRLQEGVGSTIVNLTQAGIKVWMLTGDKFETAINIGIATGLLEPVPEAAGKRPEFKVDDYEVQGVFQPQALSVEFEKVASDARIEGRVFEAMIIDGKCLEHALDPANEAHFVAISRACKTVVCCRVSPKQKGAVVRLMRNYEKTVTLAIGDGANDCNMIQSADVGIGIRGLEGLQAFNVCDYGISQFRFLETLLLVHGRWCYRRIAILINIMFYKNLVLVLPQYFFGFVSGCSGQKIYNDIHYQGYNIVLSMFPLVVFAIFDQDVPRWASTKYPELYAMSMKGDYFNKRTSLYWFLSGVWHAFVCFIVPYHTMTNGNITNSDGKSNDLWMLGTVILCCVLLVVNLRVLLESCFVTSLTWVALLGSLFFWFVIQAYISGMGSSGESAFYGSTGRMFGSPMLFLVIIVTVGLALLPDVQVKGVMCNFSPSVLNIVHTKILTEKYEVK